MVLKLADKAAKKVLVKLHPCLPVDEFKEARFLPGKSNIRKQWYTGEDGEGMCDFNFSRLSAFFMQGLGFADLLCPE